MTEPDIYQLDVPSLDKTSVFAFIGRCKSGKSNMIKCLCRHFRHDFERVVVYCGSKKTLREYAEFIPPVFCHDTFDPDEFTRIYDAQERDWDNGVNERLLVIVDDFGFNKTVMKSKPIRKVLMNGRNAGINLFISLQDAVSLEGPGIRGQIDYVFLAAEKNPELRKRAGKLFNVGFGSVRQFDAAMRQLTMHHTQMVIMNAGEQTESVSEDVFWYRAPFPVPKFKFAPHSDIWSYNKRHYNQNHSADPNTSVGVMPNTVPKAVTKRKAKNVQLLRRLAKERDVLQRKRQRQRHVKTRRKHHTN